MPFNSKEFDEFAKEWGFKQTTSSPTYAQSNGMSEKAVQTVKRILKKADDPYIGLMEYRNTPVTGMTYSPSQLLMSRIARTKIQISQELLLPAVASEAKQQLAQQQKRQKQNYDKSTKPLPPLEIGENVHLRQGTSGYQPPYQDWPQPQDHISSPPPMDSNTVETDVTFLRPTFHQPSQQTKPRLMMRKTTQPLFQSNPS